MEKIFRYTFQNADGKKQYEIFTLSEVIENRDRTIIEQYIEDGYELVNWCEQYIGLDDINETPIFEGDKVRFTNPRHNQVQFGFISLENASFCIKRGRVTLYKLTDFTDIEVVEVSPEREVNHG